jgi:GxxExxY protein
MRSFDETRYPHSELTGQIIAAATAVHAEMRPGLAEALYERALCIEVAERSFHFEQQKVYPVRYKTHYVGDLTPDLIVEGKVIVDLKVVEAFNDAHLAQMLGYLNITGLEVGLLVNFKHAQLQVRRMVNQHQHRLTP